MIKILPNGHIHVPSQRGLAISFSLRIDSETVSWEDYDDIRMSLKTVRSLDAKALATYSLNGGGLSILEEEWLVIEISAEDSARLPARLLHFDIKAYEDSEPKFAIPGQIDLTETLTN